MIIDISHLLISAARVYLVWSRVVHRRRAGSYVWNHCLENIDLGFFCSIIKEAHECFVQIRIVCRKRASFRGWRHDSEWLKKYFSKYRLDRFLRQVCSAAYILFEMDNDQTKREADDNVVMNWQIEIMKIMDDAAHKDVEMSEAFNEDDDDPLSYLILQMSHIGHLLDDVSHRLDHLNGISMSDRKYKWMLYVLNNCFVRTSQLQSQIHQKVTALADSDCSIWKIKTWWLFLSLVAVSSDDLPEASWWQLQWLLL